MTHIPLGTKPRAGRTSFSVALLAAMAVGSAGAADLQLASVPLYLGGAVDPNIMFTLDDSGSMQWEFMPDHRMFFTVFTFPRPTSPYNGADYTNQVPDYQDNNLHNYYSRSALNNAVFYNPDVTYVPWSNADGSSMGNATPTCAYYNPASTGRGCLNLTTQQSQYALWFWNTSNSDHSSAWGSWTTLSFWPITYYNYNGGTGCTPETRACYTRVQITNTTSSGATFTSPRGITRTRDQEIQNFANWFQYYRSRVLAARAGVGRAFARQGSGLRVGFAAINEGNRTIDGASSASSLVQGLRPFSGADRTQFFSNLYNRTINTSGTPLRSAAKSAGQYFQRTDNSGPWAAVPGGSSSTAHLACRQSYLILMTDGFWNGPTPSLGNVDNTAGPNITGPGGSSFTYAPAAPYSDVRSDTLADVGMYYWNRDLRSDIANQVPTNPADPAFWQHLVTFTVGLGVTGDLDPAVDLPALTAGTKTWGDPANSNPAKIDDMWHAALNSRGSFFSASDPDTFANSLAAILNAISDRTSSAAAIALNAGAISTDSKLFQARFNSGDWSGQLLAYAINADGSVGSLLWDAGTVLRTQHFSSDREILTFNGTRGVSFRWPANPASPGVADLSASQVADLKRDPATGVADPDAKGAARLNWLRGDGSNEGVGYGFRIRTSPLGDLVHSNPVYAGGPGYHYPDYWDDRTQNNDSPAENAAAYSLFKTRYAGRTPMVYAGANDGMLHAFRGTDGREQFAYVPAKIYPGLSRLPAGTYSHRYYVDGPVTVADAFYAGAWRSVLLGGLAGGGQGIYALEVTDPAGSVTAAEAFTEANAASRVLWEYRDSNDRDLGYTYSQPNIVRLHTGPWAAVFGNGYNNTEADGQASTTGNAVLYVVDLQTGALIKKLDTGEGMNDDPLNLNRPNGLATVAPVDVDGDYIIDYVYGGDLFGNLWKFDLTGSNANQWSSTRLFTAKVGSGAGAKYQPITSRPEVGRHPKGNGYMIYFGTGKYVGQGDNAATGQDTQSFYGIWDKKENNPNFTRSDLVGQQILKELTVSGTEYRVTSDNAVSWTTKYGWYLDLVNTQGGNTNNRGERQVSRPVLRNGRIIFTTLLPSDDPCAFGGDSWLMEVDANDGTRLSYTPFDTNNDGSFDVSDYVDDPGGGSAKVQVGGRKSKVGIVPTPAIAAEGYGDGNCTGDCGGGGTESKYESGSTGSIERIRENSGPGDAGRQSWQEIN